MRSNANTPLGLNIIGNCETLLDQANDIMNYIENVNGDDAYAINVVGEWLYYIDNYDGCGYRMRLGDSTKEYIE